VRVLVEIAHRETRELLVSAKERDRGSGAERVAAGFEVVLFRAQLGAVQARAQSVEDALTRAAGSWVRRCLVRSCGRGAHGRNEGESFAVELAADRSGQRIDGDEATRLHGRGEALLEPGAELPGLRDEARLGDVECQELLGDPFALHGAGCFANSTCVRQHRLDLLQLDAVAAQLDLRVDAAFVVQSALSVFVHEVAAAVDPAERRVHHKALAGEFVASQVAAGEAGASEAEFARLASRYGPQRLIEHVRAALADRTADRDGLVRVEPRARHRYGAFGRPIAVLEPAAGSPALDELHRHRLAADIEQA
jgi:hypothetical protein